MSRPQRSEVLDLPSARGARLFVTYRQGLVFWGWHLLPTSGLSASGYALTAEGARAAARHALAYPPPIDEASADHPTEWVRIALHLGVAAACLGWAAYLLTHP